MTRDEWNALAERCEQAEGPDDYGTIALTTRDIMSGVGYCERLYQYRKDGAWFADGNRIMVSLDAITTLIEREFPGCGLSVKSRLSTVKTVARLFLRTGMVSSDDAATPSLALCAAFCRAMAAKETA